MCEGFVPRLCQPSTKCLVAVVEVGMCGCLRGRGMLAVCAVRVPTVHADWVWACVQCTNGWLGGAGWGMWLVVGRGARAAA